MMAVKISAKKILPFIFVVLLPVIAGAGHTHPGHIEPAGPVPAIAPASPALQQAYPDDFGDAPKSYGSADHVMDGARYLGSAPDGEASQQYSDGADADDLNGTDDEDGVTFPDMLQGSVVSIPVKIVAPALNNVYLNAWFDWNGDGDFDDENERVASDIRRPGGNYNLSVTIPADANAGKPTFARFRLGPRSTNAPVYTSTGTATYGEVEDYLVKIRCTEVKVPQASQVIQPACGIATGIVTLQGLPGTGTWTLTRMPDGAILTGTGTSVILEEVPSGTWNYTVTNQSGCTSQPSDDIVIDPAPETPGAPVADTIIQPSCTVSTGSVILAGLPSHGNWSLVRLPDGKVYSGSGISFTVTGMATGTYNFTVTNSDGCISGSSDDIIINSQPSTPSAPVPGAITHPTCDLPTGSVIINGLPLSGTWILTRYPGTITLTGTGRSTTISGLEPGTYNFTVTNDEGCTSAVSSDVTVNPQPGPVPVLVITNPDPVCAPGTVDLTDPDVTKGSTPNLILSYWKNAQATIPYTTPAAATRGTYYIKGTMPAGCSDIKPVIAQVSDPPVSDAGPDQVLRYMFSTRLNAGIPGQNETGTWSVVSGTGDFADASDARTTVNNLALGENVLLWTVSNGVCLPATDQMTVTVNDLLVPTLITPDMNGKNDYFVLAGIESLGRTVLLVFDRRGVLVYENNDYDNLWNGTDYNGNPLADDTYFFIISPEKSRPRSGFLVIRR